MASGNKKKMRQRKNNLSQASICKPVNPMTGCWEISVGNSLMASIWSSRVLPRYHSPHLPFSSQDGERRGIQSVDADSAGAAINKLSLLFIARPEHHPEDRRASYHLKGTMQTPGTCSSRAAVREEVFL